MRTDTIVAVATPPGRGPVGIVRLSGAEVPRIARALLGTLPAPRHAHLAAFRAADGEILDHGLALYFSAPHSFTGEHVLELHAHGGPVVLDRLRARALELGCRAARAGEFSERAFLNGKMDIAEAEAVAALIEAGTAAQARAAVRSLRGELSARIASLQAVLTELRMQVEAAIDFSEEDLEPLARERLEARLERWRAELERVVRAARQGVLLHEGMSVVIAGRPNAGKSTLLNRLAGQDLAIVTPAPGTTRDVLRAEVALDGLPVRLLDTAGLRSALDEAEAEGIRRARLEIEQADRVLWVKEADAEEGEETQRAELPAHVPVTLVVNKIDRVGEQPRIVTEPDAPPRIHLSALTGAGLELLRAHLIACAGYLPDDGSALAARRRHLDALERARRAVEGATRVLEANGALELFAEELRLAQHALGEITGEFTPDDLLGAIFATFCIGK